ncbi:MAG: peptidase E [Firmicutes bacterium]|nr:peptidase E [Bacillota bacterium]
MRKLVCIGGGEIPRYKNGKVLPYETKEIDEEIVRLSQKENPKLLFISIASSHPEEYFEGIKKVYEDLGCVVSHLNINQSYEDLENELLGADIIYIGGGNTKYLIEKLNETGIDKLLIKAYNKGIVCSGLSAGSYCWFKYNYDSLEGMGVINAINCVHYDQKDETAKNKFYNVITEKKLVGYALDNCVAIEFIDDEIKIVKSNKNKNAYKVLENNNKVEEIILEV